MNGTKHISDLFNEFDELTKTPECFLNCDETFTGDLKTKLKKIYDFIGREKIIFSKALQQLLIKNFDSEQIWQQIDLQNEHVLTNSIIDVSKLLANRNALVFNEIPDVEETEDSENELRHKKSKNTENNDVDISDELELNSSDEHDQIEDEISTNVDINDVNSNSEAGISEKTKRYKKSIVDDEFFNLQEMEDFLKAEERKTEGGSVPEKSLNNSEDDSESDIESLVDLFKEGEEDDELHSKTAKFKDFFRPTNDTEKTQRNKFLEEMDDEDDENPVKSTLELRQERLSKRIEELEENVISEKPWMLKGEIKADDRPQNSLLEEIVEFDIISRPAPVITEQATYQLEDIIKQRINEKKFDSVIRKEKPIETPLEYKKKLVLDQEKSKTSLQQIYEQEFIKQQEALDPDNVDKEDDEPELHKEIRTMMNELFCKLDALSNFHFTTKPAVPELKIVTNLPAVVMEEVAPISTSEASLLAPEEVRSKPKGVIIGQSERTETDKKRERRKKKKKQQVHGNMLKNKGGGSVLKKLNPKKKVHDKKVDNLLSKPLKSSKAFFTQLQDQVHVHDSSKNVKKNAKNKSKASNFKL